MPKLIWHIRILFVHISVTVVFGIFMSKQEDILDGLKLDQVLFVVVIYFCYILFQHNVV